MPFTIKPVDNIVSDILFNIVQNVPDVTDLNPGSVLRQMVEAVSVELESLYDDLNSVYEGTRIETSTGDDLDNLGALVGVTRKSGTVANGYVSFIRAQEASFDFNIPADSLISTQPNTGEEQLRFVVNANTVFDSEIVDEEHLYTDGVIYYKNNERFFGTVSNLTGIAGAVPYTFVENTDFEIIKNTEELIIDTSTITVLDDCEVLTGWTESVNATAPNLDAVEFIEGSNSIKLGKDGVTNNEASYEKILAGVIDSEGKNLILGMRIKDQFTKNKIQKIGLLFGSGGNDSNSFYYEIPFSRLYTGWNRYKFNPNDATVVVNGTPNRTAINFLRITIFTNIATDVITSGDTNMDYWIFSETEDYTGDIIHFLTTGTVPDDGTDYKITYKPLSKEVLCDSEAVGDKYNVGSLRIMYKVSIVANIDSVGNYTQMTGGTDIESDDDFRDRIQLATQVQAKATATALRQAVLAVDGIVSVGVDDLPQKTENSEPHIYNSAVTDYKLDFEVGIDDATLLISDTFGGGADYVKGTDYILDASTIIWLPLGAKPVHGNTFYVTYNYNWLGHVEMFVAGVTAPLSPALTTEVTDTITETKAAGVIVAWSEPTIIYVDTTVEILADTENGYTFAGLQPLVSAAIQEFLNTRDVGDEVYLADIIQLCQDIDGVVNTTISLPVADVTITNAQVARAGSIVVNSL